MHELYDSMSFQLKQASSTRTFAASHLHQHTSAHVSTRQHTSAYVSIRQINQSARLPPPTFAAHHLLRHARQPEHVVGGLEVPSSTSRIPSPLVLGQDIDAGFWSCVRRDRIGAEKPKTCVSICTFAPAKQVLLYHASTRPFIQLSTFSSWTPST